MLAADGSFALVDVNTHSNVADNVANTPAASMYYTVSLMHCMPISLVRFMFECPLDEIRMSRTASAWARAGARSLP